MLKLVLLAQSRREIFSDMQGDLTYLLALYGLPAAGVLAVEMLKQETTKQYTPGLLPRSETIQDLSVFISSLAVVGPGEGNFSICDQGRRSLKRVLDQILSPTIPAYHANVSNSASASGNNVVNASPAAAATANNGISNPRPALDDQSAASMLYFPTANDAEFLQWLDNVEWDKGMWLDSIPVSNNAEAVCLGNTGMSAAADPSLPSI